MSSAVITNICYSWEIHVLPSGMAQQQPNSMCIVCRNTGLLLGPPNIYILCISHAVLQGLRNGRSHMRDLSWMWHVSAGPLIPLQTEAIRICQTATKGLRIIRCGHSSAACSEQVI